MAGPCLPGPLYTSRYPWIFISDQRFYLFLSIPSLLSSLVAPWFLFSSSFSFFSRPNLFATSPPLCVSSCVISAAGEASRRFSIALMITSVRGHLLRKYRVWEQTCLCSFSIFNPAPYHAPATVMAVIDIAQIDLRIVCRVVDIVHSFPRSNALPPNRLCSIADNHVQNFFQTSLARRALASLCSRFARLKASCSA